MGRWSSEQGANARFLRPARSFAPAHERRSGDRRSFVRYLQTCAQGTRALVAKLILHRVGGVACGVLRLAPGALQLTLVLLLVPFGFHLAVAGGLSGLLLHRAARLAGLALEFVHVRHDPAPFRRGPRPRSASAIIAAARRAQLYRMRAMAGDRRRERRAGRAGCGRRNWRRSEVTRSRNEPARGGWRGSNPRSP